MSLIHKKSLKQLQKAFKGVKFLKNVFTYEDFLKKSNKFVSDVNNKKMAYIKESVENSLYNKVTINGIEFIKISNDDETYSLNKVNRIIKNFLLSEYGKLGYNGYGNKLNDNIQILIGDNNITFNLLDKCVNNYTIFKNIIRTYNIESSESFYKFILENTSDIYGFESDFLKKTVIPILIKCSNIGNNNEELCKKELIRYTKSKEMEIKIINSTIEEDINGVDFYFEYDNKKYSVQVKTFKKLSNLTNKDYIIFKNNGSSSILNKSNYLMLINSNSEIFLLRTDDVKVSYNNFITKKENILNKKDL